ncbi:hypothetical protein NXV13_22380 [Bacteroides ovatus]|nr:hypothetical protein [Bacteroides ovatus]
MATKANAPPGISSTQRAERLACITVDLVVPRPSTDTRIVVSIQSVRTWIIWYVFDFHIIGVTHLRYLPRTL